MAESRSQIASRTAKGGIETEDFVKELFNNWKKEPIAQKWLLSMNYDLSKIESVSAEKIGGISEKADVAVRVVVRVRKGKNARVDSIENIQVKRVSNKTGSNQLERRHIYSYKDKWHMSDDVLRIFELFTGEVLPDRAGTREPNRMYMDEFSELERKLISEYLEKYMVMIISDIIRGRGRYAVEWILVIQKYVDSNGIQIFNDNLMSINEAINYFVGDHKVHLGKGIKIGNVSIQRKGGDDPKSLQFKADPSKLLNL